jgi:predicted nucleic acid-binding protein
MILTDAGPLIAILDRREQHHQACVDCLAELTGPMLTTWPAFSEAIYLLDEACDWPSQDALWQLVESGNIELAELGIDHRRRMRALMDKYQDRPMDLADASLVALAEERNLRDIFTLDQTDFGIYRVKGRHAFRVWPREL